MDAPRQSRQRGTFRSNGFAPRRSYHRHRRRVWFLSRIGSNELLMGAVFFPLLGVAAFFSDASFKLDDLLKYIWTGAVLLALGWGMHAHGKLAWQFASRARVPRRRSPTQVVATGPWGAMQSSTQGKVLPFELRPAGGARGPAG